jgi:hypothetical protein
MDKATRFKAFMESLRTEQNGRMVDSILEGFQAIHEAGYVELDEAKAVSGVSRGSRVDPTMGVTYRNPGETAVGILERMHALVGDYGDRVLEAFIDDVIKGLKNRDTDLVTKGAGKLDARLRDNSSPAFGTREWGAAVRMFDRIKPHLV